jgi:two-component system sensor histidine kinase DesK
MAAMIVLVLIALIVPTPPAWPNVPSLLMLAVQAACCSPRRRLPRGWWLPVVQAVLFVCGGQPSFLAASVLLNVAGRLRWTLFTAVSAAATLMKVGPDGYPPLIAFGTTVSQGLLVFTLIWIGELRDELRAGRDGFAAQAVAREGERAARDLDRTLGSALSKIVGLATQTRPQEIVTVARTAAGQVRRPLAPVSLPRPDDFMPWLAAPVGVAVYLWFSVVASTAIWHADVPVSLRVADLVAVVALQAYHTVPRPLEACPRYAGWTLSAQLLLCALPLFSPDHAYSQLVGWAVAPVLVILPSRAAWPVLTAFVTASTAVVAVRSGSIVTVLSELVGMSCAAILFYGLARLAHLVQEVRQASLTLATVVVARERRRISSDVHDLLGAGLSAIIIKAELAVGAPSRMAAELDDITRIARSALADLHAILGEDEPGIFLRDELVAGREVLTAAGVTATVETDPPTLPRPVDALLATVLREAVTNVLRHSRARHCDIAVSASAGQTCLRVVNDGVPPHGPGRPGQGHANLTARVAARHGRFSAGRTHDSGYMLTVRIPLNRTHTPA